MGERLNFKLAVDAGVLDCAVPALLLQPLVENAIRHGIEPSSAPGTVWIAVRQQGEKLAVSVEDTGAGPAGVEPGNSGFGIGLSNLRARLATLHGKQQDLTLCARPQGGMAVHVAFPCRAFAETAPRERAEVQ